MLLDLRTTFDTRFLKVLMFRENRYVITVMEFQLIEYFRLPGSHAQAMGHHFTAFRLFQEMHMVLQSATRALQATVLILCAAALFFFFFFLFFFFSVLDAS